jgi:hypothetical protein
VSRRLRLVGVVLGYVLVGAVAGVLLMLATLGAAAIPRPPEVDVAIAGARALSEAVGDEWRALWTYEP